jgi:peptidoglycan pentaglycine glycine transferase (the first glycine)
MQINEISSEQELDKYAQWLQTVAPTNIWQSLDWKRYQEALQKRVRIFTVQNNESIIASALVVIDTTTFGYNTWELPRGPVWQENRADAATTLVEYIRKEASKGKCLVLYTSPFSTLQLQGFKSSNRLVHPEATSIVSINGTTEQILAAMKPKGRYNCKVAIKNLVTVQPSTNVQPFIDLHTNTAKRNAFTKPQSATYKNFLECVSGSFLLYAYVPSTPEPIAGLIGVITGDTGIYYYGASNHEYRATMAPYALQCAAIEHCKKNGCTTYDLFGIAPPDVQGHPWDGVTRFKQQFGGEAVLYLAEQQCVFRPLARLALQLKRKIT